METILFLHNIDDSSDKKNHEIRPLNSTNTADHRSRPLSLIVAIAANNAIGRNGDLLWHLRGDLQHFKSLTMGHPVIMGRNTWISLPKKPLPGRRNIVLSRDPEFIPEGAEKASGIEEALDMCISGPEPFIIGGAGVYEAALPLTTTLYLTLIDASPEDADTFFPKFDPDEWEKIDESEIMCEEGRPSYRFVTLSRRK